MNKHVKRKIEDIKKKNQISSTLVVQWLGLSAFTAVGPGSIPGRGAKIPQATRHSQKKKKKKKKSEILIDKANVTKC